LDVSATSGGVNASCFAIELAGETLELHPNRSMWWAKEKTLLISDVHLGKSAHFRKHGIAIPKEVNASSLARLEILIRTYSPERVLVLGDLFHSDLNAEWAEFRHWLIRVYATYSLQEFRLVEGNHDVLPDDAFDGIKVTRSAQWSSGPFDFVHDPRDFQTQAAPGRIGVAGHLHPAIRLSGRAKQQLRLPGWWWRADQQTLVMPNFGTFTGSSVVNMKPQDRFWICTDQSVMPFE
jgi:DNA ligase-associated metallophosphoesterase